MQVEDIVERAPVDEVEVAAAAAEEDGGPWEKHHDAASGHDYWENKETGVMQWTDPHTTATAVIGTPITTLASSAPPP